MKLKKDKKKSPDSGKTKKDDSKKYRLPEFEIPKDAEENIEVFIY